MPDMNLPFERALNAIYHVIKGYVPQGEIGSTMREIRRQMRQAQGDDPAGCPAGHGDQCCRNHAACREAMAKKPPYMTVAAPSEAATVRWCEPDERGGSA